MYAGKGTCLACPDSCKTCVGPKNKDCSSCYPDHKLHISTCVQTCPTGTQLSSQGSPCLTCPHTCSSCKNETCTSCHSGYYLQINGSCDTQCRPGQFPDSDGVCKECHHSCKSCYGPGSNQCLDSCPHGFYRKDDSYVCTPCHSSCTSCSGEGIGNCSSCSTSKLLRDGLCISCDPGYYLNISSRMCHPCNTSCGTCSGPDHNQCTDCTGQLHLDSWSSVCVPCCNNSIKMPSMEQAFKDKSTKPKIKYFNKKYFPAAVKPHDSLPGQAAGCQPCTNLPIWTL